MLKAVPAESGDDEQAFDLARRTDDWHAVGGHLVESRPRVRDSSLGESGQPLHRRSCDLLKKLPTNGQVVTRGFIRIRHSEENPSAFAMKIERGLEIYDHDFRSRHTGAGRDRFSYEDVPAIRKDRNLEPNHLTDVSGIRSRCIDHCAG